MLVPPNKQEFSNSTAFFCGDPDYRRRSPSLLVAEGRLNAKGQAVVSRSKTGRGKVAAPIFLLVPQVKLPKRLDLARDAARA